MGIYSWIGDWYDLGSIFDVFDGCGQLMTSDEFLAMAVCIFLIAIVTFIILDIRRRRM